jgi:DNA-binding protein WhiA
LQVDFSSKKALKQIENMLSKLNIPVKTMEKKNQYSFYLKEGEQISRFLALIGANKAVLKFEDIRIQKEMRGKVNRIVNCETANLTKTLNASIEQIAAIRKLQKEGKFNQLDDNLKEIANLRLDNPNMPLAELGKMLKNPIGKSGANYRLKKIVELANE